MGSTRRWDDLRAAQQLVRNGLSPLRYRIRFYLDSFRVQLVARELAKLSVKRVQAALAASRSAEAIFIAEYLDFQVTPERLAQLMADSLYAAERLITEGVEALLQQQGHRVATSKDLESAAFALWGPRLFQQSKEITGDTFLDVESDGLVFAPAPIDTRMELARLRRNGRWVDKNLFDENTKALSQGKLVIKPGVELDFAFSQKFVDCLADYIGKSSRQGRYQIRWSQFVSLKEKGVDADLIVNVMDDLHSNDVDAFVFFTNDSDFAPLISRIRESGKLVILCGLPTNLSKDLIRATGSEGFLDLTSDDVRPSAELWLKSQEIHLWESLSHVMSEAEFCPEDPTW